VLRQHGIGDAVEIGVALSLIDAAVTPIGDAVASINNFGLVAQTERLRADAVCESQMGGCES
jgi:hypothetical protein